MTRETLRQKREAWCRKSRAYRERHRERLAVMRRSQYDPIKQKECQARYLIRNPERVAELRKANYVRNHKKLLAYANKRGRERLAVLAQIKLERGCVDCGYRVHPDALEFDHIGKKTACIWQLRTCSMERLLAEIANCEVVCANCHRVRASERRGVYAHIASKAE